MNDNFLLEQTHKRAGFYSNRLQSKSVTHAITRDLEERCIHNLDVRLSNVLPRDAFERWSWEANSSMSRVFLLLPPDQLGFIEDPAFQVAVTT